MSKFPDPPPVLHRIFGIGLLFLIVLLTACSPAAAPEKQPVVSTLRVVMDNNYPPYVFQDEQGLLQGILVDQWKLWEERTGVKVEITALPWGEALERMKAGEFDVIDTVFYTADRARIFDFTDPYAQIDVRIFFQKNISGIANVEGLKGFRVAVKKGDANADYLLQRGVTDLAYYDSYEEIIQAARRKEETIFVIDQPPALYFLYKFGIQNQFNYSEPLYGGAFHRAVRKGNATVMSLVIDGFSRITKAEYQEIDNRWFGTGLTSSIQQIMPYLAVGAAIALVIIFGLFAFNRILQSRVQSRTSELREALLGLQKSEARFRESIEFLPIPIGIADAQGNILSFNRKFFEHYGYSIEDISSMEDWLRRAYPDPEYRAKVQSQWDEDVANAVQAETSSVLREYRVTCKDGSQRDVEIIMHPIGDLWVASFNNVTERKQAEEALRENEVIFSSFLEHSPVYVFFKDKYIRSLRLSKNYEQMLGMPISAALGKTMDELFPSEFAKSMVVDDLRILNEGQPVDVVEELNGRVYETTKFPVLKDGKPFMLAGFTVDITERRQAEEALRESEENYRNLVELSPDAIIVHSGGKVVFANPATVRLIRARDITEILGLPVISFVHPDMRAMIATRIKKMQEAGVKGALLEEKFVCMDGAVIDVEVVAMPIHFEGRPAIQVVVRDITERKQMLNSLVASEEKYRTLIETINTGIFMSTLDGKFLQANSAIAQMAGYDSFEEFMRIPASALYANIADRERIIKELQSQGFVKNVEILSIKKDSTQYWISISAVLLKDPNGEPVSLLGSVVDITERRRSVDAIQQSEKRFRTLIENSADALALLNADGSVFYEGPTVKRLTGFSAADRLGKSSLENIYPADLQLVRDTLASVMAAPGTSASAEFRSIRQDGAIWWTEATATNLLHDPGVRAIVVNYRDVTDRKHAEDELRNSETRFRILFEHAGVGVAMVDTQTGRFIHVNQKYCDIVGYTREEMEQVDFPSITHPDDLQNSLDNMERLKDGEISEFSMEKRYYRKDGKIVWVLLIVSPLLLPGEQVETHIAVIHDITEKKRTEYSLQYSEAEVRKLNAELERRVAERTVQLEVANKELEAFSYSVSHDLRAPLRAIEGFSRIVLDDHASQLDGEVQKLLGHIRVESQHMAQLIDALLNLSRMSRAKIHKETVDLSSQAHQVLDGLRQSQPQRQVECLIANDITAQGDARLLYIVLENLLGNAWKFTSRREQAHIEFGMDERENELVYFVRDDGAGFDLAYADKLFGAFQRLHPSEEFEGTGIGLATVQRIVNRHGGRVWAESEVGKGATFYFTLG